MYALYLSESRLLSNVSFPKVSPCEMSHLTLLLSYLGVSLITLNLPESLKQLENVPLVYFSPLSEFQPILANKSETAN